MTLEELVTAYKAADRIAIRTKRLLAAEYAYAHNSVKIGDIIEDHIGPILVEDITIYVPAYNVAPSCVYYGIELKKDKTPKKSGKRRQVYQINVKMQQSPQD